MAQQIDTYLQDSFTDGAVRFNKAGVRDLALNNWKTSLGVSDDTAVVSFYYDGVLTNASASKPVALVGANVLLRAFDEGGDSVGSVLLSSWITTTNGVYTVDMSAFTWSVDETHVIEVVLQATFTNPAVVGKTSIVTDNAGNYPQETLLIDWASAAGSYNPTAEEYVPVDEFDSVSFALDGNISFK